MNALFLRHHCTTSPLQLHGLLRYTHIDLCFNIGEHNFDTMQAEEYIHDGIKINMVSLRYLIKMKANINKGYGGPRSQDIEDIKFLAEKLNLDPSTGQPKK